MTQKNLIAPVIGPDYRTRTKARPARPARPNARAPIVTMPYRTVPLQLDMFEERPAPKREKETDKATEATAEPWPWRT